MKLASRSPPPRVLRGSFVLAFAALCIVGCAELPSVAPPVALVDAVPRLEELRDAREGSRLERICASDGVEIPVRVFGIRGEHTPVVMTHGLQSHSGWFVQSARFLARTGRPVYALDRRGSGMSAAPRGDCDDYQRMIDDIDSVVRTAAARHEVDSVHVLGHCFGAIPAALYACRYPWAVRSLVLATPGIHTHSDLSFGQKLRVLWSRVTGNETALPVPLQLDEFSDLERFQRFIATDALALRQATASFYYEVARARDALEDERESLRMPIFLATARRDRICDNAANQKYVESLPSPRKLIVEYPEALHILEFGVEREAFFEDLARWVEMSSGGE